MLFIRSITLKGLLLIEAVNVSQLSTYELVLIGLPVGADNVIPVCSGDELFPGGLRNANHVLMSAS